MRVLNVNSYLDLRTGGGTAERTFQMSRFLARENVQCTVLTLNLELDEHRIAAIKPATVVAVGCLWKRFFVPRIRWSLIRRLVRDADVVHLMGHWSVLNALVYLAVRLAAKPYAVCPAGALPLFGRSGRLKRLYNFAIGSAIIRNASAWIAVTPAEFVHFEAYGIPSDRITVIPNGVCEEDFAYADTDSFRHTHGLADDPVILFMGRLSPVKGPDLLLQAFAMSQDHLQGYRLVIAGPDGGMLHALRETALRAGLSSRVHFIGYVGGTDKVAAYRIANLLVVPSRQEAMSIVALEAGICGTPALLTDQCGFSMVRSINPHLEVPATSAALAERLTFLLAKDAKTLKEIAPLWQEFVKRSYTWNVIVAHYIKLYGEILDRQLVP